MIPDTTGFDRAPTRYLDDSGRETIDLIRDSMSDHEFGIWCRGQVIKYESRDGKKAGTRDGEKALWYRQMAEHVLAGSCPDPRHERENFIPYKRASMPEAVPLENIKVLDHGFVRLVETWGHGESRIAEAGIIEAARQSTQGSFRGWRRDKALLKYLYENRHSTPFEFAGMSLEIRAPIFVFRQWMRHRTQSYSEASARYTVLPELHYVPTLERVMMTDGKNKQAGAADGAKVLTKEGAEAFIDVLRGYQNTGAGLLEMTAADGVPKELVRLFNTVGLYSQMRASANLRNWLGFLTLRLDPHAQWETRQYAEAVYQIVKNRFPRTAELFDANR